MTPADVLIYNRITQSRKVHNAAPCCVRGSYNLFTQPSRIPSTCANCKLKDLLMHIYIFTAKGEKMAVIMTGRENEAAKGRV